MKRSAKNFNIHGPKTHISKSYLDYLRIFKQLRWSSFANSGRVAFGSYGFWPSPSGAQSSSTRFALAYVRKLVEPLLHVQTNAIPSHHVPERPGQKRKAKVDLVAMIPSPIVNHVIIPSAADVGFTQCRPQVITMLKFLMSC